MDDERRTADEHAEEPARARRTCAATRRSAARRAETERVSVVNEPQRSDDDEYRWHTGLNRPTGVADAVEFVDVHKAFGRNKILRGLNMGIPEGKISMILGPVGHRASRCASSTWSGCCTPTRATSSSTASRCPTCTTTSCSRCARSSASSSRTARSSAR